MVIIKRKDVHDLLVYFQKKYNLYFVEFREAPNGRKEIVLTKYDEKEINDARYWVCIILMNFKASVHIATFGDYNIKDIEYEIKRGVYKGLGKKCLGKWLNL